VADQSQALLEARSLTLSYSGKKAVEDVSFRLDAGSFAGLIGSNGAGKTTLLLSVSGQFKPQSGRVVFLGMDAYERNVEYKRHLGMVHEEPFLYPFLTAEEFLWFIARVRKMEKSAAAGQIETYLDAMGLSDERNRAASNLSLGMRKKLAIAAALMDQPRLLFLDEALSGLDVESIHRIKILLRDFTDRGGSILLSSHNLDFLEKICDRYLVLHRGKLIADMGRETVQAGMHASGSADLEGRVLALLRESQVFPSV
jgi:ABC-2 type transport system ATP-binding protein